ncbi:hypothetical protein GCM10009111_24750 [Colwellia asteriadis]|uniref:Uncharacterized protein n=1 Tax=Colwellia asteriadis TaxID=517723 RepID=A0ABN1L9E0_9GAMM
MNQNIQQLAEEVAKANDAFYAKYQHVDTLMGIMDKTLRQQGISADAITIDCVALDKKIVLLVHDNQPEVVDVALGNKAGEIFSSSKYEREQLDLATILAIMQTNFINA